MSSEELRAGAAKVDISPEVGIQIAGDIGRRRLCTSVMEPLYARALVLQQGDRRYCILSLNVLAIDNPWAEEVRRRAQESFGLPPEAVMIHITQNHAAPSIGNHFCRDTCNLFPAEHSWLRGGDVRYNEPAVAGTMNAIGAAIHKLEPVTVSVGRTMDGRLSFNRRFVMRDGTVQCHPQRCDPDILHVEGPTDPEVGLVTFMAENGRVIAALLHHTCHPCHGIEGNEVIAGWPGAWCAEMESCFGDGCTALVINGCCGNVSHSNPLDPNQRHDHVLAGKLLAESVQHALENMTPMAATPFTWTQRILQVPRREIAPELLAEAEQILRDHPEPPWKDDERMRVEWDWVYAIGIIDIANERESSPNYPYEIQAVRIGEFVLLSLMGEPFVEAQLEIKRQSPFPFMHVAHMCNGYLGYVPTERAFAGGGYEIRTGRGSRLVPGALAMIEDAAIKLLSGLRT